LAKIIPNHAIIPSQNEINVKLLLISFFLFNLSCTFVEQVIKQYIMKNFQKSILLVLTIVLTGFWSCTSDEQPPAVDNSIAGIASRSNDLSTLVAALNRAGLTETLKSGGPYTVFAPTNAAFQTLLTSLGASSLNDIPVPLLKEILLNHVVNGRVLSTDLTTGYIKTLATPVAAPTQKMSMYINTASGVRINGISSVSTPNILASNGVVHVVNAVITLPTVVTFATSNPNFSTLVTALTTLTPATDFVTILSGTGAFTVFAPTNDAFTALNTELAPGGIAGLSEATLTSALRYHVVTPANVLSSTLTNNQVVPTLQGQSFTVLISGSTVTLRDSNNRISGIAAVDVQANNGVVHVLNRVMLPN
jgi:uncharacterized surface protein with fasciclin (FAS1) repeats